MLKQNERGFTLLETMAALSALMVCTSFIIPIYIHTVEERKEIKKEENALTIMNHALNEWSIDNQKRPEVMKQSGERYMLKWDDVESDHIRLCLRWQVPNKRNQSICGGR